MFFVIEFLLGIASYQFKKIIVWNNSITKNIIKSIIFREF